MNIFEECCDYTLDPFWKEIFFNCSIGKFPTGMYLINNGKQIKAGEFIYDVKEDPEEMTTVCMNIFKNVLKIKSSQDKEENVKNFKLVQEDSKYKVEDEWSEVKLKSLKDKKMYDYLLFLQEKYNLNKDEIEELNNVLKINILLKKIQTKDFTFNDGKIQNIEKLVFDEETRTFDVQGDITYKDKSKVKKNNFGALLTKYINTHINNTFY